MSLGYCTVMVSKRRDTGTLLKFSGLLLLFTVSFFLFFILVITVGVGRMVGGFNIINNKDGSHFCLVLVPCIKPSPQSTVVAKREKVGRIIEGDSNHLLFRSLEV